MDGSDGPAGALRLLCIVRIVRIHRFDRAFQINRQISLPSTCAVSLSPSFA